MSHISSNDEDIFEEGEEGTVPTDMDYVCVPAVFSDDRFNPPQDISFMEIGEMLQMVETE